VKRVLKTTCCPECGARVTRGGVFVRHVASVMCAARKASNIAHERGLLRTTASAARAVIDTLAGASMCVRLQTDYFGSRAPLGEHYWAPAAFVRVANCILREGDRSRCSMTCLAESVRMTRTLACRPYSTLDMLHNAAVRISDLHGGAVARALTENVLVERARGDLVNAKFAFNTTRVRFAPTGHNAWRRMTLALAREFDAHERLSGETLPTALQCLARGVIGACEYKKEKRA